MKDYNGKVIQVGDTVLIACIDGHVKPCIAQATVDEILINKKNGEPRQDPMVMLAIKGAPRRLGIKAPNVPGRIAIVSQTAVLKVDGYILGHKDIYDDVLLEECSVGYTHKVSHCSRRRVNGCDPTLLKNGTKSLFVRIGPRHAADVHSLMNHVDGPGYGVRMIRRIKGDEEWASMCLSNEASIKG